MADVPVTNADRAIIDDVMCGQKMLRSIEQGEGAAK